MLGRWACLLLVVFMAGSRTGHAQAPELGDLRAYSLELVNGARKEHGLAPLDSSETLNQSAQAHAEDMLQRGYFSHSSPQGETVMDRYRAAGGEPWRLVSENIGQCSDCSPPPTKTEIERQQEGWMNSPEHRRNILRDGLTRYGFGVAVGEGGLYAVQNFSGPGEPRGLAEGQEATPLASEEMTTLAADLINAARRDQGLDPIEADADLAEAAQSLLPPDLSGFELNQIDAPYDALSPQQQRQWQQVNVIAGSCGGCGAEPTDADVRFFVNRWLDEPQYRNVLLRPALDGVGLVLRANGEGRKAAVAILGER